MIVRVLMRVDYRNWHSGERTNDDREGRGWDLFFGSKAQRSEPFRKKMMPAASPCSLQPLENLVGDSFDLAAIGLDDQIGDLPVHGFTLVHKIIEDFLAVAIFE